MERIGRYRLTQRIGSGSFATVYRGHDDELDVPVAVKVLNPEWVNHGEVEQRFLTEARLLRRIQDEHIVRVYDIGRAVLDDGQTAPYFVMDFADAGSFEQLRKQVIPSGRALRLCAEAARALDVLHRNHVVHRDVTPGNILLSNSRTGLRVLIADLGVAESLVNQTSSSVTAGTPAYMAYEQATDDHLDPRSDIYSMAAVTYALLTGHPPFAIRTVEELQQRSPNVDPPLLSFKVGAPAELDQILARALSPYPDARPSSAAEFADQLDAIADLIPIDRGGGPRLGTARPITAQPNALAGLLHGEPDAPGPQQPVAPRPQFDPSAQAHWSAGSVGNFTFDGTNTGVAPRNQTPASMLENYLGKGRYEVAPPKERHHWTYYLYLGLGLVAVFALALVLTINLLG